MLALLNWRIWAAVIAAFFLSAACWKSYHFGKSTVQAEWNVERLERADQSRKFLEKAAANTADLQAKANKTTREKNAQIQALNSRVSVLNTELRNRPQRPSGASVPTATSIGGAPSGCTGAGLYGQDAEFSLGEAATAQILRINLKACYQQYNAARAKFEALTTKGTDQ